MSLFKGFVDNMEEEPIARNMLKVWIIRRAPEEARKDPSNFEFIVIWLKSMSVQYNRLEQCRAVHIAVHSY